MQLPEAREVALGLRPPNSSHRNPPPQIHPLMHFHSYSFGTPIIFLGNPSSQDQIHPSLASTQSTHHLFLDLVVVVAREEGLEFHSFKERVEEMMNLPHHLLEEVA